MSSYRFLTAIAAGLSVVATLACAGAGTPSDPSLDAPEPTPASTVQADGTSAESPGPVAASWLQVVPPTPPGRDVVSASSILCQPEVFVPGEREIVADPTEDGVGRLAGDTDGRERSVRSEEVTEQFDVEDGVTVTRWTFTCEPNPSFRDEVLELRSDGERLALFTHIHALHPSPDGRQFYMVNLVRSGQEWVRRTRIVDARTLKAIELPPATCHGWDQVDWPTGLVVTMTNSTMLGSPVEACVFSEDGQLLRHVRFPRSPMLMTNVYPGDPPFLLATNVDGCEVGAVNVATGEVRIETRELDEDAPGFDACLELPRTFDAEDFATFGERVDHSPP